MSELCLVTGGAGFIGSHLVEGLTAAGQRVRVLDDLATGQADNLAHIQPAPELFQGDVTDPTSVQKAMTDVRVVYHLAALASVQLGIEQPARMHNVCAGGTLNVLEAAKRCGVRRVVYAASASAYGVPVGPVQSESDPLSPLSVYAAAKLAGEMYCQAYTATHNLETVRLRFFNIFGPRQRADSPYSGVIALFVAAMSAGRTPTIFGDGLQTRDFTHVSDVVQALQLAAQTPGISGEVYNIGAGGRISLLDLVAGLNRLLGTSIVPKHGPARAGDIRHSSADIARAVKELGYRPQIGFEEGLRGLLP